MRTYLVLVATAAMSALLAACGGGDIPPPLTDDQAAFESFALASNGGLHNIEYVWDDPMVNGTDFMYTLNSTLGKSPASAGPQIVGASQVNMASSVSSPDVRPMRVLSKSVILVESTTPQYALVTYLDDGILYSFLAADQQTVVFSRLRSNYSVVPVSGAISNSPAELGDWFTGLLSNSDLVKSDATYAAGSAYLKYFATQSGLTVFAFDCNGATTDASITPCKSNATLDNFFPVNFDQRTYQEKDGIIGPLEGVRMWVSPLPRPQTLSPTVSYRVFFELNGNVYTGEVIKDGTAIAFGQTSGGVANAVVFPYNLEFNQAFLASLQSAIKS